MLPLVRARGVPSISATAAGILPSVSDWRPFATVTELRLIRNWTAFPTDSRVRELSPVSPSHTIAVGQRGVGT